MIRYTPGRGTIYEKSKYPENEELIEYAVSAYDYLLNTSERRNRFHSWDEFAAMILAYYEHCPRIMAVVSALQKEGK